VTLGEAPLELDEAVPLLYPVVTALADRLGVRTLAIKGPALVQQGLRSPEHRSVDVDVLVEPAGFDRLRAGLEELGWHDEGGYDTPGIIPVHSVNHRKPGWPCELDVHRWFPGFLADPAEVFDVLWERRAEVTIAHHPVAAPDRTAHLALLALHHLRDQGFAWGRAKFGGLVEHVRPGWTGADGDALAALAAETASTQALLPLLEALGATPRADLRPPVVPVEDWLVRAHAETTEVLPWLVGLRRTPWPRRPAYLWHAVWLSEATLVARDPGLRGSRRARAEARWSRLRRGVRALPGAVRAHRRARAVERG
jgi:hypothetical protein